MKCCCSATPTTSTLKPTILIWNQLPSSGRLYHLIYRAGRWKCLFLFHSAGKHSFRPGTIALHLGDMIHGNCGSLELQSRSYINILTLMRTHLACPVYIVKGNHEMLGKGAKKAFEQVLLPYLRQLELGEGSLKRGANYYFTKNDDLYLALDCMQPSFTFIRKTLEKHPQPRHLFVLTHYPILPRALSSKLLFSPQGKANLTRYQNLIKLLARYQAIVLCGHIHRNTLMRLENEHGKITQLTIYSMCPAEDMATSEITQEGDGEIVASSKRMKRAIKRKSKTGKLFEKLLGEITTYQEYGNCSGFGLMKVAEQEVTTAIYCESMQVPSLKLTMKSAHSHPKEIMNLTE